MGYYTERINVTDYVDNYVMRRYGLPHSIGVESNVDSIINNLQSAWDMLQHTVYNISHQGVIKNIMVITPCCKCCSTEWNGNCY